MDCIIKNGKGKKDQKNWSTRYEMANAKREKFNAMKTIEKWNRLQNYEHLTF